MNRSIVDASCQRGGLPLTYSDGSPAGRVLKRRWTQRYWAGSRRISASIQRFMRAASATASSVGKFCPWLLEAHAVALAARKDLGHHRLHDHVQRPGHARGCEQRHRRHAEETARRAASRKPKSMSGRLKKPSPLRMARNRARPALVAREDLGVAEPQAAATQCCVHDLVALALVDRDALARLEQQHRGASHVETHEVRCQPHHRPLAALGEMDIAFDVDEDVFSRSGEAYQRRPRSRRLRPSQRKCSRASASRSASPRSGKHSSRLRSATLRRDADHRVAEPAEQIADDRLPAERQDMEKPQEGQQEAGCHAASIGSRDGHSRRAERRPSSRRSSYGVVAMYSDPVLPEESTSCFGP